MQHPAPRALFGWTALALAILAPGSARAQTIAAAFQPYYPDRLLGGQNFGPSTRLVNLNPYGVNHDDCIRDMTLQYNLLLTGFSGQSVQVWATRSGDCTSLAARGSGGVPTCWLVNQGLTSVSSVMSTSSSFNVRVQDLVGPQNAPPNPVALVAEGPSACSTQSTFAAVPITLWFLPLDAGLNVVGTPYSQQINTDMVGPPSPTGVTKTAGDTLIKVTWIPNSDLDTVGYDVFIDPPPGLQPTDAAADAQLYCPDSATPVTASGSSGSTSGTAAGAASGVSTGSASGSMAGAASGSASGSASGAASGASGSASGTASGAASGSASGAPSGSASGAASGSTSGAASASASGSGATSGSVPTPTEAGCIYVNFGPGITGKCGSAVLTGGTALDASTATTPPVLDQDGTTIEGGSTTTTGGGVSTIPCAYGIGLGGNCYSGGDVTITGESSSSYTIPGLVNGVWYNVVLASVDGSGNVGPPSPEVCDYPAPVSDFWKTYRTAGGQAGGGFCALETLGAPAGASFALGVAGAGLLAAVRRRRRGK